MSHIIIRIPNWLGDAVMASGAIWDYCQRHQKDSLYLFGIPNILPVFYASPFKIDFVEYDRSGIHKGFSGFFRITSSLRKMKLTKGFLLPNSFYSALLYKIGGVRECIGKSGKWRSVILTESIEIPSDRIHQSSKYDFLLGGNRNEPIPSRIYLSEQEKEYANQLFEREGCSENLCIGMAVGGAYGSAKRWFPERYAELARICIKKYDARILLFASQNETEITECIVSQTGDGVINLAGQTSLRELIALIERCNLMIGNDSGVMHVAAAVNTLGIVLFGPTNPIDTIPTGDHIRMIKQEMECAPCMKRECPLKHHACMKEIQVEDVMQEIDTILEAI